MRDPRTYLPPLVRSIAAPPGSKLVPSRSHGIEGPSEHFVTEDNMTDRGNPYAWGTFYDPPGYSRFAGQQYGPIPQVHNADVLGLDRDAPRPAVSTAYVTAPQLWNLSGIATGWSDVGKPNPVQPVRAQLAFGALGSLLIGTSPAVRSPLPTLPEPARMVAPGF